MELLLPPCGGKRLADDRDEGNGLTIATLSGDADRVSGGDALVEIAFQRGDHLTIRLNGHDDTSDFRPGSTPNSLVGLVTGLSLGRNTLSVEGRRARNSLHLTNYSFPRKVAGGPLSNSIIKCQLKPIDLRDYSVSFTQEELNRLHRIFRPGFATGPDVWSTTFRFRSAFPSARPPLTGMRVRTNPGTELVLACRSRWS
jgi:hypothetical protein